MWFLYHLDNQGIILDKVDLELHHADWVNNNNKAIFPKMGKGDSVVATQNDMPVGVSNWETTLCCPKCLKYHYTYQECKVKNIAIDPIEQTIKLGVITLGIIAVLAIGSTVLFIVLLISLFSILFGGIVLALIP